MEKYRTLVHVIVDESVVGVKSLKDLNKLKRSIRKSLNDPSGIGVIVTQAGVNICVQTMIEGDTRILPETCINTSGVAAIGRESYVTAN